MDKLISFQTTIVIGWCICLQCQSLGMEMIDEPMSINSDELKSIARHSTSYSESSGISKLSIVSLVGKQLQV